VNTGVLSLILTDLSFVPLPGQDGPILANIDGDIVLTTIDGFPVHKLTLLADDVRAVKSIDPDLLPCGCIITEEGMGEVARGYIEDPQGQISEQGHTITLNIPPATEALRWDTVGPGWVAATGIDTIAMRIASHSPPWTANIMDTGDPVVSVAPLHWSGNDPNVSNADLNTFTKNDGVAVGWNVGAVTQEFLSSGDGAITAVAFGSTTNRMFGFTSNFNTYSYTMLNHAIYLSTDGKNFSTSGILAVYENGSPVWSGGAGSYYPGDVLSVAIVGGKVQYLKNNIVFYTSTLAPSYPCYGACSIYSPNAAILGGTWTSYVAPKDTYYAVSSENGTVLDVLLQLATATFRHIRQKQVNGIPVQAMEIGLFNAPPTMVLKTSDGESPSQVRARNLYTRLMTPQVDYAWTSSQVISIGAAFGGGTGDQQVKLENLYNYLHPTDGSPPPTPRPGQNGGPSYYPLFPEYDDTNFPIERRVSLKGTYYYVIKNTTLIARMKAKGHWSGEIWGGIDNSSIVYVDKSPDAQKQAVERTLYVDGVTKLKRHEQLEFTATIQTEGRGRITQAGDQVNVRISRAGRSRVGTSTQSFMAADININPMVTSVIRQYRDQSVIDKWAVSTLGRLLTDDSKALTDRLRQLEAVRLIPSSTSQTVLVGPIEQTINSLFPLDIPVELPNTMSRMTSASLHVKIKPARHNVSLIKGAKLDGAHDHAVTVPPLTVAIFPLPGHSHTGYTPSHQHIYQDLQHSHAFSKGGHSHIINYNIAFIEPPALTVDYKQFQLAPGDPSGSTTWPAMTHAIMPSFTGAHHTHGEEPASDVYQTNPSVGTYPGATGLGTEWFSASTATASDNGGFLIGMTTTQQLVTHATDGGQLSGAHTHDLSPDVVETSLGGYVQVWINSGDGVFVDRSPELGGPWNGRDVDIRGNVFIDSNGAQVSGTGMERFLQAPGKSVGIRIVAINSSGNPTGICNVQVSGTWDFDKYAINSTIFAGAGNG
jgi:hypothetical protein